MREISREALREAKGGAVTEGPDPTRLRRVEVPIIDDSDPVPCQVIIDDGAPF